MFVLECMGNIMYLVEAALKPLKKTEDGEQIDDMIRQVFYGKARQIVSYYDNTTSKMVKNEMEEDFSHVLVDALEGKDLYDGLDDYFFAGKLEEFQGGYEATREVTVKSFPPVLQIQIQVCDLILYKKMYFLNFYVYYYSVYNLIELLPMYINLMYLYNLIKLFISIDMLKITLNN